MGVASISNTSTWILIIFPSWALDFFSFFHSIALKFVVLGNALEIVPLWGYMLGFNIYPKKMKWFRKQLDN